MQSILFWNELSLMMKTGTLIEKYHGPSMMNQHKSYQKLSCIKKYNGVNLVGLQRCCVFDLLPNNRTINSDVYCQQLVKLEEVNKEKGPEMANREGIVFHHDNFRPHTSLATRTKLLELGCKVMSHPPYSPDLASSDYYLFRNLQNFLNGKKFQ